jgi:hypothetical protein
LGVPGHLILLHMRMVDDVRVEHLPLPLCRLAILWMHDHLILSGPALLHWFRNRLSAQLWQGSRTVVYAFFFPSHSLFGDSVLILSPGVGTVYVEHAFKGDDFEPDLFPVDVTEKEWQPDADRASVYKDPLPELFKHDSGMA